MKDRLVLALDQVSEASLIGNKARNLRFLSKQDLPVPATFVCTADAFVRYLRGDPHITQLIRDELVKRVDPQRSYAVRSSASLEDSQDYSWAGQFRTELNVQGIDAILQAVQAVWDSSSSLAARAYLGKVARDLRDLKMSVIVQEMVSPVVSGVAFSRNPLTGMDEVVVEAVPGSGEALMQDGITPERWVNKWGQWLQKPSNGKIASDLIQQVVEQTRTIARTYGKPVDLEWVYDGQKLQWVQLRPITSLRNVSLYSNRIAREMMPGIIKPLVWSIQVPIHAGLWADIFAQMVGKNQVRVQELVKAFYYQAYFNMGVLGDILETMGMPRDGFELMMGIEVPKEHRPSFKPTSRTWRLLPRMFAFTLGMVAYSSRLAPTIAALQERWRGLPRDAVATQGEQDLISHVQELIGMIEAVELCNLKTQVLMMVHHGALKGQLRKLGLDLDSVACESPQEGLAPHDVNGHLSALHSLLASLSDELQDRIRHATFAELEHLSGAETFRCQLERFTAQFGHLSDSSNDFSAVSWGENPDRILRMVVDHSSPKAPRNMVSLDDVKMPRLKRAFLRKLAKRALMLQRHREEIGFLFTYGNGILRQHFLALGAHLSHRGVIAAPEDVFYLYWDELRTLVDNGQLPSAPQDLVATRKQEIEAARTVTPPSTIYGDTPGPLEQQTGDCLVGTPTSVGYYRGSVTVVRGLADFGKMHAGDVLVIPYSDIGWTPLFAQAGAVVAESGGILSHSSIVAREYKIPAVVSVLGACSLIDGTIVTVDGYKGQVIVHQPD